MAHYLWQRKRIYRQYMSMSRAIISKTAACWLCPCYVSVHARVSLSAARARAYIVMHNMCNNNYTNMFSVRIEAQCARLYVVYTNLCAFWVINGSVVGRGKGLSSPRARANSITQSINTIWGWVVHAIHVSIYIFNVLARWGVECIRAHRKRSSIYAYSQRVIRCVYVVLRSQYVSRVWT